MEDYKIYVTYHQDEQIGKFGLKADDNHVLFASHKDIDGKNINNLNPVYSEMVTMWYVWKNAIKSSYIGFNHYRRHFDVNRLPASGECQVYRILDFGEKTIYEQYAECHNSKDMDVILSLLDEKYGDDNQYTKYIRESHHLIANCCYFMRWADFNKLCKFLFPLLEDFAAKCGISNTNVEEWHKKAEKDFGGNRTDYQTRVVSFLAERLISAYIFTNMAYYLGGFNVAIVHYNTPELTEAAIKSLFKHTRGCHVFVFDNSDTAPFKAKMKNVEVINNTKGQIINFEKELAAYPDKMENDTKRSNYGSAKHAMSVDKLMELIPDGFILMDSDVLVTDDLTKCINRNVACGGSEQVKHNIPLLMPFACWINVPMLREAGIRYFNGEKMWALSSVEPNCYYDTGAWLLEEARRKQLNIMFFNVWQYVKHFGHGSWKDKDWKNWLEENKELWQ